MSPSTVEADYNVHQLIGPEHPFYGLIWVNPQRVSGAPCFHGTRVPIKNLWDYLAGGEPLDEFVEDFEGVTAEQARDVLRLALEALMEKLPKP